jgi:hypothetical protein
MNAIPCSVRSFGLPLQFDYPQKPLLSTRAKGIEFLQSFIIEVAFFCSNVFNDRLRFSRVDWFAIAQLSEHVAMSAQGRNEIAVHVRLHGGRIKTSDSAHKSSGGYHRVYVVNLFSSRLRMPSEHVPWLRRKVA